MDARKVDPLGIDANRPGGGGCVAVKTKLANADVREVDPSQLSAQTRESLPIVGTAPAAEGTASIEPASWG